MKKKEKIKKINKNNPISFIERIKPFKHEILTIEKIKIIKKNLKLTSPFSTSFGTIKKVVRFYIKITFKTKNKETIKGIGECPPLPYPWYDGEAHHLTKVALEEYLLPLLRQSSLPITDVNDFIGIYGGISGVQRNFMAKVGIEAAYWDAVGKLTNKPVYRLWYDQEVKTVSVGTSVGGRNIDETLERIDRAIGMGIQRIKVKIKPGFDVKLVGAIREKYPNILLQVDANSAYDLNNHDHFSALRELDNYNLLMIEQPLWSDDRYYHLILSKNLKTPICLDESIENARHAAEAIQMWKNEGILPRLIINIKPPRVGGFWEAVRIAHLCQKYGVKTWCGGMLESSVGKTANIHFSVLTDLPGDHVSQGKYFVEDVAESPNYHDGVIDIPQQPGWGIKNLSL